MGRLNGRFLRLIQWVHWLDFEIFGKGYKSTGWVVYLYMIGLSYLLYPFLTMILWIAYLANDAKKVADRFGFDSIDHRNPV